MECVHFCLLNCQKKNYTIRILYTSVLKGFVSAFPPKSAVDRIDFRGNPILPEQEFSVRISGNFHFLDAIPFAPMKYRR